MADEKGIKDHEGTDQPPDHTQEQEFIIAGKVNRQPYCVHCGAKLDFVIETQTVDIVWTWNPETKSYDKDDSNGYSDKPFCGLCGARDWEFTNNDTIRY